MTARKSAARPRLPGTRTKKRRPATKKRGGAATIRAFAKRAGVSHPAIIKGIASGRIPPELVGRTTGGRPCIVDVARALLAWEANAGKVTKAAAAAGQAKAAGQGKAGALVDAQRDVAIERAHRLKFDNELRRGRYVLLEQVKREQFDVARIIREGLLNLPTRLAAELAAETDERRVYARLDAEIRQALEAVVRRLEAAS